jgi:hypothetical protein
MKMMDFDPTQMSGPTVQRKERTAVTVSRGNLAPMPAPPKDPELDSLLADLDAEMAPEGEGAEKESATKVEEPAEATAIYTRFKIDPMKATEAEKALVKSYAESEKRMRQMEAQTQALLKATATPGQPPATQPPSPIMGQVQVQPWKPKEVGEKFLDDIPGSLDQLRTHVLGTVQAQLDQIMGPVYSELVEARLDREFPGVMTKESIPIIKVLAQSAEGQTILDKYRAAAKTYQETYGTPIPKTETSEAKPKVGQPGATAKPTGKRIFYRDEIQKALSRLVPGSPEYVKTAQAIQKAYNDGRVKESRLAG